MEWLVHVVLLVLGAADENDAASVAFGALGHAGHAPLLDRMVVFYANRDGVLGTWAKKLYTKRGRGLELKSSPILFYSFYIRAQKSLFAGILTQLSGFVGSNVLKRLRKCQREFCLEPEVTDF